MGLPRVCVVAETGADGLKVGYASTVNGFRLVGEQLADDGTNPWQEFSVRQFFNYVAEPRPPGHSTYRAEDVHRGHIRGLLNGLAMPFPEKDVR